MAQEPSLHYKSSRWTDSEGRTISTCLVYDAVQIEVLVENLTRRRTITSLIKVVIFRDVPHGLDERVKEESRLLTLPPLSPGKISINFIPTQESGYYFATLIDGKEFHNPLENSSHRLHASRSETMIILEKDKSRVSLGSTVALMGKLVRCDTKEGIGGAEISIFGSDKVRHNIASGITLSDGTFNIEWMAKKMDWWDKTIETYAKFNGDDVYKPSTSNQCIIIIDT